MKHITFRNALLIAIVISTCFASTLSGDQKAHAADIQACDYGASTPFPTSRYFDMVLDEAHNRLYATDCAGGTLDVIDMTSLAVIKHIPVGDQPVGVDMNAQGTAVAVAVWGASRIKIIDPGALSESAEIAMTYSVTSPFTTTIGVETAKPYDLVFGRGDNLYVNAGLDRTNWGHLFLVNTKAMTITRTPAFLEPSGRLALSPNKTTLYASGPDYSPQQLQSFSVATGTISETAPAPHGPVRIRTLAVSGDGLRVYTSFGQVWSADLSTKQGNFPTTTPNQIYISIFTEVESISATNRIFASGAITNGAVLVNGATLAPILYYTFDGDVGVARSTADGQRIFVSTAKGIRVLNVGFKVTNTFLPMTARHLEGLYGTVTNYGVPYSTQLELRLFDGRQWSSAASVGSDTNGRYLFAPSTVPTLSSGQRMYVRYRNTNDPTHVAVWGTRLITQYVSGDSVNLGAFDVANVELGEPAPKASIRTPYTFRWASRTATSSDSYQVELFSATGDDPYFTSPLVGYVNEYLLTSVPPRFNRDVPYFWDIVIYDPDGGFGVSYYAYGFQFASGLRNNVLQTEPLRLLIGPSTRGVHGDFATDP